MIEIVNRNRGLRMILSASDDVVISQFSHSEYPPELEEGSCRFACGLTINDRIMSEVVVPEKKKALIDYQYKQQAEKLSVAIKKDRYGQPLIEGIDADDYMYQVVFNDMSVIPTMKIVKDDSLQIHDINNVIITTKPVSSFIGIGGEELERLQSLCTHKFINGKSALDNSSRCQICGRLVTSSRTVIIEEE